MGCMRLPFINGDGKNGVDREAAYGLIRYATANGINYFDTALTYHGGESEAILGEALANKPGLREKVWVTTKQPYTNQTHADIRRNLEETLKKLRTSYLDMYFIHRIMPGNWDAIQENEIYELYERFKAEGLIRHIGFSYHGNYDNFSQVVKRYPWDMCMVQHNLLDINREVTSEGVHLAGVHGLALGIMEPLRGGGLSHMPAPGAVSVVYDSYHVKRTPAQWAFRYLADKPEISVILSGMTTMEQLKANIEVFSQPDMLPGCLNAEEKAILDQARKSYESVVTIPCTECNYCMPCPAGVQIPAVLARYNDAHRFGHHDQPRRSYMLMKNVNATVHQCTGCNACAPKCPQLLDVPQQLRIAHDMLDGWVE